MKRLWIVVLIGLFVSLPLITKTTAETIIKAGTPMPTPEWALLERELLEANTEAAREFASIYLDEKGYLLHTPRWGALDGSDDAIETFKNWAILHALGADDDVLDLVNKAQEGHFLQYTEYHTDSTEVARKGALYQEYLTQQDWLHLQEEMMTFNSLGLSEPSDVLFQKRTRRFAGLYLNEDPEAQNYDYEHNIIRSFMNGSKGPMIRRATMYDWVGDPYDGRFNILHHPDAENTMYDFMEEYPTMLEHCAEYLLSAGDNPLNLLSTNLVIRAYMLTNEPKYREWLTSYLDTWIERQKANGGNIPSNVGLDGTIGGTAEGKWYGGTYGWDFAPWSPEYDSVAYRHYFGMGQWPGFMNTYLVTGDDRYLDALRLQLETLIAAKKVVDGKDMYPTMYGVHGDKTERPDFQVIDGVTYVPPHIGEEGYYRYTADPFSGLWQKIYIMSMDENDLRYSKPGGWLAYVRGEGNDDYPSQALRGNLGRIRSQVERIKNDPTTPDTRLADWPMILNPVVTSALVQLMWGGPEDFFGCIHGRVRYFDPASQRAGLPDDVAALVTRIDDGSTRLTLVNINQVKPRSVIVQSGVYGEHHCNSVESEGVSYPVDGRSFTVRLEPGAGTELTLYQDRHANPPTMAFPWHGATVPE
jgi:hypothetical protein